MPTPYAPDTQPAAATDWRHQAACRQEDPELFFPLGTSGTALLQIEEAKAVCRRCPVMEACGEWALATRQDEGVWGGMSEAERRSIRKRRGRAPRPLAPCGTDAAYRRHIKRGEEVHPECLAAHNAAQLVHYHAKKAASTEPVPSSGARRSPAAPPASQEPRPVLCGPHTPMETAA